MIIGLDFVQNFVFFMLNMNQINYILFDKKFNT